MAKAVKKHKENVVHPPPGRVKEIFPGEKTYDDSPPKTRRQIVFGGKDGEKKSSDKSKKEVP